MRLWILPVHLFIALVILSGCTSAPQTLEDKAALKADLVPMAALKNSGNAFTVSSASGLVVLKNQVYVIADDEKFLFHFDLKNKKTKTFPLLKETFPKDSSELSQVKPDFEALLLLSNAPKPVLLTIPSGSKTNRQRGARIELANNKVKVVDFSPLYAELSKQIPALNIEGAILVKEQVLLFQRGNGAGSMNAVIYLDRATFAQGLDQGQISAKSFLQLRPIDLGVYENSKLTFSDAKYLNDKGIYFLASAENTESANANGHNAGTMLGELLDNGTTTRLAWFPEVKLEGLDLLQEGDNLTFYMVNDPDDRSKTAHLYQFILKK